MYVLRAWGTTGLLLFGMTSVLMTACGSPSDDQRPAQNNQLATAGWNFGGYASSPYVGGAAGTTAGFGGIGVGGGAGGVGNAAGVFGQGGIIASGGVGTGGVVDPGPPPTG